MRLSDALRLRPGQTVAFVGAGGKSSALRRLALEAQGFWPVVLTTTTRLGSEQSDLAASHLVLRNESDLRRLPGLLADHPSLLATGPLTDEESKWSGLDHQQLEVVRRAVLRAGGILAVEADGARGRSLKVPAAHEPQLPYGVDLVVPVVGLDALGTTIAGGRAHRPGDLARFLGVPETDVIDEAMIARVLTSPEGALKAVPSQAEVRILLTKTDDSARLESAGHIARLVIGAGSLPGGPLAHTRAVAAAQLEAPDPVRAVWGRVAGVVLAAGGATRLERPKLIVPFRGRALVTYAVEAALQAGLDPVCVVVGHSGDEVRRAVETLPVRIVENTEWQAGQSSSLRLGLAAVADVSEAVVFLLADMPFVSFETIGRLLARHAETLAPIVAPAVQGRRGNPVLFDRAVFPELVSLTGDTGGRLLFSRWSVQDVPCDEKELMDVDTPQDLERLWSME